MFRCRAEDHATHAPAFQKEKRRNREAAVYQGRLGSLQSGKGMKVLLLILRDVGSKYPMIVF